MTTAPLPAAAIGLPSSDTQDLTLLRARAADAVEKLLDLLDAIDGDPDFEPAREDFDPSDNGLADYGGLDEQLFLRPRAIGHRTGSYGDLS